LVKTALLLFVAVFIVSCGLLESDERDSRSQHHIWVSPNGDDANSGDFRAPFKTIARAQIEARKKTSTNSDIVVNIKDGIYRLDKTLEFDTQDSPKDGYTLTYRAVEGNASIYGSKTIDDWTLCEKDKNIYCADAKGVNSRQFYVDGVRTTRARTKDYPGGFWPHYDYNATSPSSSDKVGILYIPLQHMNGSLDPNWPDPNTWTNIQDIEAVSLPQWKMQRVPLKSITKYPDYNDTIISTKEKLEFLEYEIITDVLGHGHLNYDLSKTGLIELQDPAWTNANVYLNKDKNATAIWGFYRLSYFENAYQFLDEEGEWHLDKSQDKIYYKPLADQNMSLVSTELPSLEKLITIKGSESLAVKNIKFENLKFAYATWLTPSTSTGYISDQSGNLVTGNSYDYNSIGHVRYVEETPGNIELEFTDGAVFSGNIFEHMGAVALHFGTGSQNSLITSNLFEDISSSAIWLGGVQKEDYAPNSMQITKNNTISNNLLRHIGQEYVDVAGIYVGFSTRTTIEHNTIMYTPWSAIAMGWGWGLLDPGVNLGLVTATPNMWGVHTEYTPNSYNKIINNRTYETLQQVWDGGGVYTTGYQGTSMEDALLIEGNVFSNKNPKRGGNTVYSDGMSRYIKVKNNVMYNNPKSKVYFGDDVGLNDPFFIQLYIYSFANALVSYGSDSGGCRTYGDIAYDENFWYDSNFFNPCPLTYEGVTYPTGLTYSSDKNITSNISSAQKIADRAGVSFKPSSIPEDRWITPSRKIVLE
jgi:hypothetical protein